MATKKDYYNIDDAYKLGTTTITIKISKRRNRKNVLKNNKKS